MSILSALKAKGAKGKNIEEAVKTLPLGGSSGDGALIVTATSDSDLLVLDKTYNEIKNAWLSGKTVIVEYSSIYEDPDYGKIYNQYSQIYDVYEDVATGSQAMSQYTVSTKGYDFNAQAPDEYPQYAY